MPMGFYDRNPDVALNEMNGFDFSLHGPLFWITEAGYALNGSKGATGLVGHYKAGIWYNAGSFGEFSPLSLAGIDQELVARKLRLDRQAVKTAVTTTMGDWGFYALMDQVLWRRGGPDSKQKVTVFGSVLVAPDQDINQMPYFVDGGIVWNGPFPSRQLDYVGFEFAYGAISSVLRTPRPPISASIRQSACRSTKQSWSGPTAFTPHPGFRCSPTCSTLSIPVPAVVMIMRWSSACRSPSISDEPSLPFTRNAVKFIDSHPVGKATLHDRGAR